MEKHRSEIEINDPHPEHSAKDAENDGDETRVINREILRGKDRRLERPRCRWQPRIVGLRSHLCVSMPAKF